MTIIIKDGAIVITDSNPQEDRMPYNTNFPYYPHFYNNTCIMSAKS